MEKTVLPIHFEDRSGTEFERLVFAYISRIRQWDKIEWLGQTGSDKGRDIWGNYNKETFCYQCANYQNLTQKKIKDDIDKLVKNSKIPDNFIVVCGGKISADLRDKIFDYANSKGIKKTAIWSGVEFEEKLRKDTPELLKRFVDGAAFPNLSSELIKYAKAFSVATDKDIIDLLAECFDRPAFTTRFQNESSIPDFETAINNTIEVLNTGVHRLRDGTVIKNISSRHNITDGKLKKKFAEITKLVVKLRDTLVAFKRSGDIKPCGCNQHDCPVYLLSEKACKMMDLIRQNIFTKFREIKKDFNLTIE